MGMAGTNAMGQPTSGGVGMGQMVHQAAGQPTPAGKGGTGSNVPAGKGSVTGGQQATNTNYPAYNPQQNTFGAMGSTNQYNPVTANMQQPQMPQSTLQLPQGGFQPSYGMYNNQPPMPGGGLIPNMGNQANINYGQIDPAYQAYAKALQGTPAGQQGGLSQPPELMKLVQQQQQQAAMGGKGEMQADPKQMQRLGQRRDNYVQNLPQYQQLQQMNSGFSQNNLPSAAQQQQMAALQRQITDDPRMQRFDQRAQQLSGQQGMPQAPMQQQIGQPQQDAMAQQAYAQQLRGLPQNPGQIPAPPMQQQIGQPNQRQQMQRFMQQFRPNRNNR